MALTREEVQLAEALLRRVAKLAAAASATGVKLMIDAEHTYFQPVGGCWQCQVSGTASWPVYLHTILLSGACRMPSFGMLPM